MIVIISEWYGELHQDDQLKIYRLLTVSYGMTPASFMSTRCLIELADDAKQRYPVASKAI